MTATPSWTDAAALDGGQLYERLLASVAEREVRRVHAALTQFAPRDGGNLSSVAHSLVRMWLAVSQSRTTEELVAAYNDAFNAAMYLPSEDAAELLLGTMRGDAYRLPAQTVYRRSSARIRTSPSSSSLRCRYA